MSLRIVRIFVLAILAGCAVALWQPQPQPHGKRTATPNAAKPSAPPVAAAPAPPPPRPLDHSRTLRAAPPAVQAAVKEPLVFPDTPEFLEVRDDRFEAKTAAYAASLNATDGLTYRPKPEHGGSGELNVRLLSVKRGARVVYDREKDAEEAEEASDDAIDDGNGGVGFWRAPGLEEHYHPRGDGVEQSFTIQRPIEGQGDLELVCGFRASSLFPLPPRAQRAGGIGFVDAHGAFAVRYGQAVVRDSARRGISVEPLLAADGRSARIAIPAAWLDAAAFPLEIDPLVGADFLVSPLVAASTLGAPSVCAGSNNYLAVWDDITNPNQPRLFGSVVSATGIPSAPIQISATAGFPQPYGLQRIESAFDGSNWLVVWSDARTVGPGIYGAIFSSTGMLLNGSDFLIAPTQGSAQDLPLATFDGIDYVVAWQTIPAGLTSGIQIFYTRVTTQGVVSLVQALPSLSNPANQALYFLAPQKPGGDTLMVYREVSEVPAATRSVRIAEDGTLRDPGGTALFTEKQSDGGFGRPIGAAFATTAWQVLSTYDQTTNSSVFMHQIDTNGVVTPPAAGAAFAVFGEGPVGNSSDQYPPAFPGQNGWLFLRNEKVNTNVYHILGKRVGFDGTDQDPLPFQIDTATQGIRRNGVAAQAGNLFLAAWLDGRKAAVQPGDATNIAAAFVDVTVADSGGPGLVPVIAASPTSGVAPLAVNFDSTASTGTFDTLNWSFGDGITSTAPTVSHTYQINGTFIAQLKLTKGAYTVIQAVPIVVGGGSGGSSGSTQVGVPVTNSENIVPSLFINGIFVNLDFTQSGNDLVHVGGIVDLSALPAVLTGVTGSVTVGTVSHSFTLDAKGQFKSDATTVPLVQFEVSPKSGLFIYNVSKDDLRADMNALGATDQTVRPAINVPVPVTVTLAGFAATTTEGIAYTATQGKSGTGTYLFINTGQQISGTFLITSFSATEGTFAGAPVHNYAIQGQLSRPNGGNINAPASGQYTFSIGNFSVSLPTGQFLANRGLLRFISRIGRSGLKRFGLDNTTGRFQIQLIKIPATGASGSGLPLAGNNTVSVDLNLSFQFDLKAGGHINAGRFIFITRKNASAKGWKLR